MDYVPLGEPLGDITEDEIPDDTSLSLDAWNAKVEALLRDVHQWHAEGDEANVTVHSERASLNRALTEEEMRILFNAGVGLTCLGVEST